MTTIQTHTLTEAKAVVVARRGLRPEVAAWSAMRIMSAIGHPGYGRKFSEAALIRMADTGRCAHDVVYADLTQMKVRVSYTVDVSDETRRAINAYHGQPGMASRIRLHEEN